jgi:hypothetical protein
MYWRDYVSGKGEHFDTLNTVTTSFRRLCRYCFSYFCYCIATCDVIYIANVSYNSAFIG